MIKDCLELHRREEYKISSPYDVIRSIIIATTFYALTSLTGSAILSNSYSGYNNIEAMIIVSIGSPFTFVIAYLQKRLDQWIGVEKAHSFTSVILGLSTTSVISSLIGYAVYNEFNETEMTVGKTAAASAVGSAILVAPLATCCVMISSGVEIEDARNRNTDEESNIEFVDISAVTDKNTNETNSENSQTIKSIANIA